MKTEFWELLLNEIRDKLGVFIDLKDGLYDLRTDDCGSGHPTKLSLVNESIIVCVKDPEKYYDMVVIQQNSLLSMNL